MCMALSGRGARSLFLLLFIQLSHLIFTEAFPAEIIPVDDEAKILRNDVLPYLQLLVMQNVSLRCESLQLVKLISIRRMDDNAEIVNEIDGLLNGQSVLVKAKTNDINALNENDYTCEVIRESQFTIGIKEATGLGMTFLITSNVLILLLCLCAFAYCRFNLKERINEQRIALRILHTEVMSWSEVKELQTENDDPPTINMENPLDLAIRVDQNGYGNKFELNRENLNIQRDKKIATGDFCNIWLGILKKPAPALDSYALRLNVAVQEPKDGFDVDHQKRLIDEMKILSAIPPHPNVLAFIGAVTKEMAKGHLSVVIELCGKGSLKSVLKRIKRDGTFRNDLREDREEAGRLAYNVSPLVVYAAELNEKNMKINEEENPYKQDQSIYSTKDLLSFSMQIASGMDHLSSIPCFHRGLAARNVYITNNNLCRIGNFGMSKNSDKDDYRKGQRDDTPMPVRWMSPEAIGYDYYTQASDVWSYGIQLYEIFTLGGTPYPNIETNMIYQKVQEGERNEQPEFAHDDLYNLMQQCWQHEPNDRPRFQDCVQRVRNHLHCASSGFLEQLENQLRMEWPLMASYSEFREVISVNSQNGTTDKLSMTAVHRKIH